LFVSRFRRFISPTSWLNCDPWHDRMSMTGRGKVKDPTNVLFFPQSVREWDHGPRNPCLVKMAWICRCLTLECNYLDIFSVLICLFRWIVIICVYMIKLPEIYPCHGNKCIIILDSTRLGTILNSRYLHRNYSTQWMLKYWFKSMNDKQENRYIIQSW
jgi:hypothetical protein